MAERTTHPPITLDLIDARYSDAIVLRLAVIDDSPWFVVTDLCRALKINSGQALHMVEPDDLMRIEYLLPENKTARRYNRSDRWAYLVSEFGANELAFRNGFGEGRAIRYWISHKVVPAIRDAGLTSASGCEVRARELGKRRTVTAGYKRRQSQRHVLYRFYDADGALLYVGISWRLPDRMHSHRSQKSWWTKVHHAQFEHHPSRESAETAEQIAIQTENPRYNVIGR